MSDINTAENLRSWLRSCPAISGVDRFGVDFLGKDPTEYAIYSSPSPIKTKTDILGNVYLEPVQELNYIFVTKCPFSRDILQNMENLGFFSGVMDWIYKKNVRKEFPEIAEGRVLSIMPALSPYMMTADSSGGRYQIQLKIRYRCKQ